MQSESSGTILPFANENDKNSIMLDTATSNGVVYATVDKTPRVCQRKKKKAITAPPRRKNKQNNGNYSSIGRKFAISPVGHKLASSPVDHKLASSPIGQKLASSPVGHKLASSPVGCKLSTSPVYAASVSEQKAKKPIRSYRYRNRWKSQDMCMSSNLHKENNCSYNSDLHKPFLPEKSGKRTPFTPPPPEKIKDDSNSLTKLEILKQHWQQTAGDKDNSFVMDSIEKDNETHLQENNFSEADSPSRLEGGRSSACYWSISSDSQTDVSSYETLLSVVDLDSDLQSGNDNESCKSSLSVSDISKDFDNSFKDDATSEKPQVTKESVISDFDILKNFDNLVDEISASENYPFIKSCNSIDFDSLIEILDVSETSSMKSCKQQTMKNDICLLNHNNSNDLIVKCNELSHVFEFVPVESIQDSAAFHDTGIQDSATDHNTHIQNSGIQDSVTFHQANILDSGTQRFATFHNTGIQDSAMQASVTFHNTNIHDSVIFHDTHTHDSGTRDYVTFHSTGIRDSEIEGSVKFHDTNIQESGTFHNIDIQHSRMQDSVTFEEMNPKEKEPHVNSSQAINITDINRRISDTVPSHAYLMKKSLIYSSNPEEKEVYFVDSCLGAEDNNDCSTEISEYADAESIQDTITYYSSDSEENESQIFDESLSSTDTAHCSRKSSESPLAEEDCITYHSSDSEGNESHAFASSLSFLDVSDFSMKSCESLHVEDSVTYYSSDSEGDESHIFDESLSISEAIDSSVHFFDSLHAQVTHASAICNSNLEERKELSTITNNNLREEKELPILNNSNMEERKEQHTINNSNLEKRKELPAINNLNLEERKELPAINNTMNHNTTYYETKEVASPSTQSIEGSVVYHRAVFEKIKSPNFDNSLITLDTLHCNRKNSNTDFVHAKLIENPDSVLVKLTEDSNSVPAQLIEESLANHSSDSDETESHDFDHSLSTVDVTDISSSVPWNVSELWDTVNNKSITNNTVTETNKCMYQENFKNNETTFLKPVNNILHSNLLECKSQSSEKLEKSNHVEQTSSLKDPQLKKLSNGICTNANQYNSIKENKPQMINSNEHNLLKGNTSHVINDDKHNSFEETIPQVTNAMQSLKCENFLMEKYFLESSQHFSKIEKETKPPSEQIMEKNSSFEVSLNTDVENWHRANNSSGTFANSPCNSAVLGALQKTFCSFDELAPLNTNMETNKNVPAAYTDLTHSPHFSPISRFEKFERNMMPSPPLGLFTRNKMSRQTLKPFLVNLCIEGHQLHVDPFPYEIYPNMTVRMLKMKVNTELGIKSSLQRWILGNVFADDDDSTLLSYGVFPGSYVFLYVDSHSKETLYNSSEIPKSIFKIPAEPKLQSPVLGQLTSLKAKTDFLEKQTQETMKEDILSCHENQSPKPSGQNTKRPVLSANSLLCLKARVKNKPTVTTPEPKVASPSTVAKDSRRNLQPALILKSKSDFPALPIERKHEAHSRNDKSVTFREEEISKQNLKSHTVPISTGSGVQQPHVKNNISSPHLGGSEDFSTGKATGPNMTLSLNEIQPYLSPQHGIRTNMNAPLNEIRPCPSPQRGIPKQEIVNNNKMENDAGKDRKLIEMRENYERFLQLENLDLVPNADSFECPICLCFITENQGAVLRECLHSFCRDCLLNVIVHACESSIKCPYRDDVYSCNMHLQQREIKALVSTEIYEQYLQRSLTAAESIAEKSFHCKNPDCLGWCLIEDNANIFHCPVCAHYNCLTCQAIHEGLNCRQYQDNLKRQALTDKAAEETLKLLAKMVRDGQAMKCPKCCVVLMKKWGCDWLKCSVCQTEVCWITKGPRWGPEGRGDISAGCKCGVDGKKCHPSCTYCH